MSHLVLEQVTREIRLEPEGNWELPRTVTGGLPVREVTAQWWRAEGTGAWRLSWVIFADRHGNAVRTGTAGGGQTPIRYLGDLVRHRGPGDRPVDQMPGWLAELLEEWVPAV
ncbi:hypothetical protein [Longimicrobium sp.]|jgi:hypothetical protein|uniref:hypothetical protein n=1 Tax=Longimicrobium sp. TaxID=2029185 RepID=UPI002EDAD3D6